MVSLPGRPALPLRPVDELAAAAGISRSFVSLVEHGAKGIDVIRLMRIAAALDVPLPELVQPP